MKKIILALLFLVVLTCVIPFGGFIIPKYEGIQDGDIVSNYNTIVWQYSYTCIGVYNDYSIRMVKRIDLFGSFTIYEKEEKMMYAYSGGLVPWETEILVSEIPMP